jgi:DNA-binding transcriptional MerR regulator
MMDKAPDAFRTISEAADELDLPQHVLRFWETKFSQIKPLKRGGGRRYYRPNDVLLLKGIRHLLYAEGYTIKGVQKIIKEQGVRAVADVGRHGAMVSVSSAPDIEMDTASFEQLAAEQQAEAPTGRAVQLTADERQRLRQALDSLVGCRAMIDHALVKPARR